MTKTAEGKAGREDSFQAQYVNVGSKDFYFLIKVAARMKKISQSPSPAPSPPLVGISQNLGALWGKFENNTFFCIYNALIFK